MDKTPKTKKIIGIDFDNTIICYDKVFGKVALDMKLIPEKNSYSKLSVRNFLRETGQEGIWTRLQGEVYGNQIIEAVPFDGVKENIASLLASGFKIVIISHKTKYPYIGPKYDLHKAARKWLEHNGFLNIRGINYQDLYFLESQPEKIQKITDLGCTHFIDDLPEILDLVPNEISKALFRPDNTYKKELERYSIILNWNEVGEFVGRS